MNLAFTNDKVFIQRLTEIIEKNLHDENFGVRELARETGLNHSTIYRRVKAITNKSISQFIRELRLKKALDILQRDSLTVAEVAFEVGFGSQSYFNNCFHDYFGYPPGEVRRKTLNAPSEPDSPIFEQTSKNQKAFRNFLFAILGSLVILTVIYFIFFPSSPFLSGKISITTSKAEKSIAIIPFKNLSSEKGNQYFADGMMEEISNLLFRIKDLSVISRASVEQFRDTNLPMKEIAGKLGVNFVLEGSVQRSGDKVRINVQLIDVQNDKHIWVGKYDRELKDVLSAQSEIATQIARELQASLSQEEVDQINKLPTQNPEAYVLYLKGRYFWRQRTEEALKKSHDLFTKAVAVDPSFAQAYAGLSDTWFIQAYRGWEPRMESYAKAKQEALRALELDPDLAEVHATLGGILTWSDWRWEEARKELLKAIELNPNYATAHQFYSELLNVLGDFRNARVQIDIAFKLDPFSYVINVMSAYYHYYAGEYEECLSTCRLAQDIGLEYDDWPWMIFNIHFLQGQDSLAIQSLITVKSLDSLEVKRVYAESGMTGILNWLIESELRKEYPYYVKIAKWNALLGNKEKALSWLEKIVEMRLSPHTLKTYYPDEISFINIDPEFHPLRVEPRFQALLKKMGLDEYPPPTGVIAP